MKILFQPLLRDSKTEFVIEVPDFIGDLDCPDPNDQVNENKVWMDGKLEELKVALKQGMYRYKFI